MSALLLLLSDLSVILKENDTATDGCIETFHSGLHGNVHRSNFTLLNGLS